MLTRIKKSFDSGVKNVKWIATFLAERTKVETTMAKLLYENSKLESKLDELYCNIGKRVLELKEKGDKPILKDFIVLQMINEIKSLRDQMHENKNRAHSPGPPPE